MKFKIAVFPILSVLLVNVCYQGKNDYKENHVIINNKSVIAHENSTPDVNKQVLLRLVNGIRRTGCSCGSVKMPPVNSVVWNERLETAAKIHCKDMDKNNFLGHKGSDGSLPTDRVTKTGFVWTICGENIADGVQTEQQVFEIWVHSHEHCQNMMNREFKFMAVARSGNYWTQVFASD
jgi:uncharacterized protein YkwD